ncbi:MAG: acyl-CoA dehydrogenase family protein [Cyanobacteriota/Melainabacteria group bacterium]
MKLPTKAGHNAVQIFGSCGFSDEYPVERFFRDAKVLNIYEGTKIQKMIIAQDALGIRYANGKQTGRPTALAFKNRLQAAFPKQNCVPDDLSKREILTTTLPFSRSELDNVRRNEIK